MAFNQGTLKSSVITGVAKDAGVGQRPDVRRLYDFSDRVAELMPEESPFFVYLSQVAKQATDDSVFRYLENRTVTNYTARNFNLAAAVGSVSQGQLKDFTVDDGSGGAIGFLTKGMVIAIASVDSTAGYAQVLVRVESAPNVQSSNTTFSGRIIDVSESSVSGHNTLSDNDACQIVGTSFEEGTGSPDTFSDTIEDDFGYTQIFKTACA